VLLLFGRTFDINTTVSTPLANIQHDHLHLLPISKLLNSQILLLVREDKVNSNHLLSQTYRLNYKNKMTFGTYLCFSLERLSLIISICSAFIKLTSFSFAQATQLLRIVFKKIRGTFTSFAHASSVNLTSGSIRSAA